MSKRLRKRIRELCGLEGLERTKRRELAQDILDSSKFKQRLCNKVNGLSFRDIERTMQNVLDENKPTVDEQEEQELRRIAPQKFNPDAILGVCPCANKKTEYRTLTREETRKLLEASNKPIQQEPSEPSRIKHKTWTREEVQALIAGDYDPADFKRKKTRKKG